MFLPVLFIKKKVIMKNLVQIENDCFDIVKRIKEIDSDYVVFYNLKMTRYEVYVKNVFKMDYAFTCPFDVLDERVLDYAVKTRSENRDKIIAEIEDNNQKIEKANLKKQVNALKELICL